MDLDSDYTTPLASSSPRRITNVGEWEAKKIGKQRFKRYENNLELLLKKFEQYDVLHKIMFCDINQTENCDLREVISEYVARSRMVSLKFEQEALMISDVEMDDESDENDGTSTRGRTGFQNLGGSNPEVEKRLRPPVTDEQIFSQGGTPLYAPVVRPDVPNIQLPMSDGRICNLVVKEEDILMPVLSEKETEMLANIKGFIDKVVQFNKK